MNWQWPLTRAETLALAAVVVPAAVAFVIAYVTQPDFRAWVRRPLLWPRRRLRLVLTDLVLLLATSILWIRPDVRLAPFIVAICFLLLLFHRQVLAGFWRLARRARRAFRRARRRCSSWLLWRLVLRPARDYFGVVALPYDTARGLLLMDRPTAEGMVIGALPDLSLWAMLLLQQAMSNCGSGGHALLHAYPPLLGHESDETTVWLACRELQQCGLMMDWTALPEEGLVLIVLQPWVLRTRGASRVQHAIADEIVLRVNPDRDRETGEA